VQPRYSCVSLKAALSTSVAIFGLFVGSAAIAAPAMAADQPAADSADGAESGSGEIIVTARRRGETLAHVPLSVIALGTEELAARNVTTETDLQRSVAGLTIRTGQTDNALTFSIRGQGIDYFSAGRPSVLTYLNDVPLPSLGASGFYDLESVQVLKGPQGTLFGRNTTGGAVLYSTVKPGKEFGGYASAEIGNYAKHKFQAALNLPLVGDQVLLRIAGNYETRDGWQQNVTTGLDQGRVDRQSIRGTLSINPGGTFESTFVGGYSFSGGNSVALTPYSIYSCGATNHGVPIAPVAAACIYGPAFAFYPIYQAATPGTTPGGIETLVPLQQALGNRRVASPIGDTHRGNDWYLMNTTSLEVTDNFKLKNILAYTHSYVRDIYDSFGTGPYRVGELATSNPNYGDIVGFIQSSKSLTEEIQGSGTGLSGKLTYIVGGFFSDQKEMYRAPFAFFDLGPLGPPVESVNDGLSHTRSQAIYGQASYEIAPRLKLTGGLRYTWEQVTFTRGPLATQLGAAKEDAKFSDPSWTVGLDYQATDQLLLYVVQRGSFRAGGFNNTGPLRNATAAGGGNLFLSERVRDVEVGAKFSGRLGDVPVRANLAVYNADISNIQRALFTFIPAAISIEGQDTLATVTVNIPKARVRGFEFDGSIEPVSGLRIGGNLAYTDARYTNGATQSFGANFNYGPYADTPKWAGGAFVAITLPTNERVGKITLRGDLYAQSGQYFSNLADTVAPGTLLPGYTLLGASVNWERVLGSPVDVSAFVKNASQTNYFTGGFGFPPLGINSAIPGEPRMYGMSLKVNF
jgi:iron complex outermembrane recepter protein